MAAFTAFLLPPTVDRPFRFQDRVRVPDGDTGTVIGFYRDTDSALILLDSGDRLRVSLHDLDLLQ